MMAGDGTDQGAGGERAPPVLVEGARQLLRARLRTARITPQGLLSDTAWDMMLELFIQAEQGKPLYVKQLLLLSGGSSTAAMRRIDRLEGAGFIARFPDHLDGRRVRVRLRRAGRAAMLAVLRDVFGE